jgi:hypothetical protein
VAKFSYLYQNVPASQHSHRTGVSALQHHWKQRSDCSLQHIFCLEAAAVRTAGIFTMEVAILGSPFQQTQ